MSTSFTNNKGDILNLNVGDVIPNSYIVALEDGTPKDAFIRWLSARHRGNYSIDVADWHSDVFHGVAGSFSDAAIEDVRARPEVKYVEPNIVIGEDTMTDQTIATWGLARISQYPQLSGTTSESANDYTYFYNATAGAGVIIYILDTGIYTEHNEFRKPKSTETRAKWGPTFIGTAGKDIRGHGTHVAGTAAGTNCGVANLAYLIAVKVLGDDGKGSSSSVISGINWVYNQYLHVTHGRPSVINMSLGGPKSDAINDAVDNVACIGIHFSVAAGNQNEDAAKRSPASAEKANTVGATNIKDERCKFSNYGADLDLWAPGYRIISAGTKNPNDYVSKNGTSMAAPHVAGLIAYYIVVYGNRTTDEMKEFLKVMSTKGAITDVPEGTSNFLARNDWRGGPLETDPDDEE